MIGWTYFFQLTLKVENWCVKQLMSIIIYLNVLKKIPDWRFFNFFSVSLGKYMSKAILHFQNILSKLKMYWR